MYVCERVNACRRRAESMVHRIFICGAKNKLELYISTSFDLRAAVLSIRFAMVSVSFGFVVFVCERAFVWLCIMPFVTNSDDKNMWNSLMALWVSEKCQFNFEENYPFNTHTISHTVSQLLSLPSMTTAKHTIPYHTIWTVIFCSKYPTEWRKKTRKKRLDVAYIECE